MISIQHTSVTASDVGPNASKGVSLVSPSGFPFAFFGMAGFWLDTSEGVTPGGSVRGVNIERLGFETAPVVHNPMLVDLLLSCTIAGNRPVGAQTTECGADYVVVFANPTVFGRPAVMPYGRTLVAQPASAHPSPQHVGGSLVNGSATCALSRFSFVAEPGGSTFSPSFLKKSALGAGVVDCDSPFDVSHPFLVLVNGKEVFDYPFTPNQEPYGLCDPPWGSTSWCHDVRWSAEFGLDGAVLVP